MWYHNNTKCLIFYSIIIILYIHNITANNNTIYNIIIILYIIQYNNNTIYDIVYNMFNKVIIILYIYYYISCNKNDI